MGDNQLYQQALKFNNTKTGTTTTLRSGQAKLHRVIVNNGAAGTFTIFNNSEASGEEIAIVDTTNPISLDFAGIILDVGLTIVNSSTGNVTVIYE